MGPTQHVSGAAIHPDTALALLPVITQVCYIYRVWVGLIWGADMKRIVIRTLTPCPTLVAGRVTGQQVADWGWTEREITIRSCLHCKTTYLDAGRAWVCEHHHEGLF